MGTLPSELGNLRALQQLYIGESLFVLSFFQDACQYGISGMASLTSFGTCPAGFGCRRE